MNTRTKKGFLHDLVSTFLCLVALILITYSVAMIAVAQTNPTYRPVQPLFSKWKALVEANIFLLEQRQVVLQAQVTYVTAQPAASQILLEDGSYVLREDWLSEAGLANARIDELLLALQ